MKTVRVATGITTAVPSAAVSMNEGYPNTGGHVAVCSGIIKIAGGASRTCVWQGSPNNVDWFDIGVSRTTAANFAEQIFSYPFIRLNVSAISGSTIDAWLTIYE